MTTSSPPKTSKDRTLTTKTTPTTPTSTWINLPSYQDCTRCSLHAGCQSVGIATEVPREKRHQTAVLIVGEAPGAQEDKACRVFVGDSGLHVRRLYIEKSGLSTRADIYITNVVRCRPPQNADPTPAEIKACRPYLDTDIRMLAATYGRVVILAVGGIAVKALFGCSLKDYFKTQGQTYTPPDTDLAIPVYATYHPAYLLAGRSPSAIRSVEDHLRRLLRFLDDTPDTPPPDEYTYGLLPPFNVLGGTVSIDIETYGALAGHEQTVFHPRKSVEVDGVPRTQLIATVACTFVDGTSGLYLWSNPTHRGVLHYIVRNARALLGQNILFDLQYLRCCDPTIKEILDRRYREGTLRLWDLAITNYLYNEIRPERSLKALAPLYGHGTYTKAETSYEYPDANDPDLHLYNVRDTARTMSLHYRVCRDISDRYPHTNKISPYCWKWYSDLLWTVLYMSETGHPFDREKLEAVRVLKRRRTSRCEVVSLMKYEGPLSGKGSQSFIMDKVKSAALLLNRGRAARLDITTVRKAISSSDYNLKYLEFWCPDTHYRRFFKLLRKYRASRKLTSTYLDPLLDTPTRTPLLDGKVYPTWYVVPSAWADDKEGGTNQSRLASHGPATQTLPPIVKKCTRSRFKGGTFLWVDLSQIELRMAALLSQDPHMVADYMAGKDRHAENAKTIYGAEYDPESWFQRQIGKHTNFLTLFLGTATKLQWFLWKKAGLRLPYSQGEKALQQFWNKHTGYNDWIGDVLYEAQQKGYLELPFIGQSKTFSGSRRTVESQKNAIANFPIQTLSSNVILSAATTLTHMFKVRHMRTSLTICIHDALGFDCPPDEVRFVRRQVARVVANPPFYQDLCKYLGHTLPLGIDIDEWRC